MNKPVPLVAFILIFKKGQGRWSRWSLASQPVLARGKSFSVFSKTYFLFILHTQQDFKCKHLSQMGVATHMSLLGLP